MSDFVNLFIRKRRSQDGPFRLLKGWHTADMSAVAHSRHVCRVRQQTCLLSDTADSHQPLARPGPSNLGPSGPGHASNARTAGTQVGGTLLCILDWSF